MVFPVTVTPPPDFEGSVKLRGKISWLTCNDEGCIPGDAEVFLESDIRHDLARIRGGGDPGCTAKNPAPAR